MNAHDDNPLFEGLSGPSHSRADSPNNKTNETPIRLAQAAGFFTNWNGCSEMLIDPRNSPSQLWPDIWWH